MKTIELFEQAATKGNEFFRENNLNLTLYWAYRKSKQNGNELIDFPETIWEEDIEPIADFLKAKGITEFTISSTFSSLIPTLVASTNGSPEKLDFSQNFGAFLIYKIRDKVKKTGINVVVVSQ